MWQLLSMLSYPRRSRPPSCLHGTVIAAGRSALAIRSPVHMVPDDAKLSDVRVDAETGPAPCVVDVGTTMGSR